jgi:hypothetical protein
MRVATWNLARCSPEPSDRVAELLGWIARIDADVWVLTEMHQSFIPGPEYQLFAHSADAPDLNASNGECWVAIWSRLPAKLEDLHADLKRVAAIRMANIVVVGTVLPWLSDDHDPVLRGEAAFKARLEEQAVDWERLRTCAIGLCVIGDFNQDLLSTGHYYGSTDGRAALQRILLAARLECLTGGADDPLAGSAGLACIDHICVGGLRARGQPRSSAWPAPGELPRSLTDHYGVWADVEEA